LEFIPAWLLLKSLEALPRAASILIGKLIGQSAYFLAPRLRRTADRNLSLALPELKSHERSAIVKSLFRNIGRLLGEFAQFPRITPDNIGERVVYQDFDNYQVAAARGKGVLFLTGHVGAWELCAFAHGAFGNPLNFLVRPLDNPLLDRLITNYRCLSGNRIIDKNNAVKPVLSALGRGEAVGFLIDINTLEDQGIFCEFFGIQACTPTGLAVFALRSEAPVVPGFLLWDEEIGKYRLKFEPEVQVVKTGDSKEEISINTALFTKVIENYARQYPDQWLWVHKRWNTRPAGEPDLYAKDASPIIRPAPVKWEREYKAQE
jgi:KDO2-lipid IV(A) lauroyltransferase